MNLNPTITINVETCLFEGNRLHVFYSVLIDFKDFIFRGKTRTESAAYDLICSELSNYGVTDFDMPEIQGKWKLR